jgi:hypothetical protein
MYGITKKTLTDVYQELENIEVNDNAFEPVAQLLDEAIELSSKICTRNSYTLTALEKTWKQKLQAAGAIEKHLPSHLTELDEVRKGVMMEVYSNLYFGI